jgi:Holliday junction resolvase RusA-like endonuclease
MAIEEKDMIRIEITPLSVNKAYCGRKYKTKDYLSYERAVMLMLPKLKLPEPPFILTLEFGFSSPLADLSNPIKLFEDILQKKYGFNDKEIFKIVATKVHTKKGNEFINFKIENYEREI